MTDKSDRELMELAARASGIKNPVLQDMRGWGEVRHGFSEAIYDEEREQYWNPLADDGDALRLAVKLHIEISMHPERDTVTCEPKDDPVSIITTEALDDYGTRRAIVRAAAAIGEAMP